MLESNYAPGCDLTAVWLHHLRSIFSGWQYVGSFINGKSKPLGNHDLGAMWECPFLTPLHEPSNAQRSSEASGSTSRAQALRGDQLYVMCVSPYPHHLKDRLTNPCLYWLGHLHEGLFMIAESDGQSPVQMSCTQCCCDGQDIFAIQSHPCAYTHILSFVKFILMWWTMIGGDAMVGAGPVCTSSAKGRHLGKKCTDCISKCCSTNK